jgi:hypothetical protein
MSSPYTRVLAAGVAAVLVPALGVTTARAATATTWTIQPGGAIHTTSGKFTFTDTTDHQLQNCVSSTASGTFKSGSGLSGADVGSLSAVSFTHCTGPAGPQFALKAGALPWHLNFFSYNVAKGVARGTISHLHIVISGCASAVIDGTGASADDGRVTVRYTDSTGRLTVLTTSSNLHFYDVTNSCLGSINDGDTASLSVTYTVSPKQAITSP